MADIDISDLTEYVSHESSYRNVMTVILVQCSGTVQRTFVMKR